MKIKRISSIKNYKSYTNYQWATFCVGSNRQVKDFEKFNLVFGENGSGKSSICEIFKSVNSGNILDGATRDTEIELGLKNGVITYSNNTWDATNSTKLFFFDSNYIHKNVHTNGDRSNRAGEHAQNSGKIIVEFNEIAIFHKENLIKLKEELEAFKRQNRNVLDYQMSFNERKYFPKYYEKDLDEQREAIEDIKKTQATMNEKIQELEALKKNFDDVQGVNLFGSIIFPTLPNEIASIEDIIKPNILLVAQQVASSELNTQILLHRDFLERGMDILQTERTGECPFCRRDLSEVGSIIDYYNIIFNATYNEQKQQFQLKITEIINKLRDVGDFTTLFPGNVSQIFSKIEQIDEKFSLNLYNPSFREEMNGLITVSTSLVKLIQGIVDKLSLIKNSATDIDTEYNWKSPEIIELFTLQAVRITDFNNYISEVNEKIALIKNKYDDIEKINIELHSIRQTHEEMITELTFLQSDSIEKIKNSTEIRDELVGIQDKVKKQERELEEFLSDTIPQVIIAEMQKFLNEFNIDFSLTHIEPNRSTNEYPFSFTINDSNGIVRSLKQGLSEGERQILSLAFFFASIKNVNEKGNKIIVFDDPITSLDAGNLKKLVDLLYSECKEFGQVFIFTHHPLFYKYCSKNMDSCLKFGIIKNQVSAGGSLIYYEKDLDVYEKLENCFIDMNVNIQNGTFSSDEYILQYGHLLRLAIERFIKKDLLLWDKEEKFDQLLKKLTENISIIDSLSPVDIESILKIYKFCNHANVLHEDKEAPTGVSELTMHITNFVDLHRRFRS
jgi:wobble nucleotide-excising tRNase